ncbi:synaptotagmin-14 isoform X1 [Gadus morhua]|uniref:synaptotagmin-14 isoform X1 n=1 Tax=Gadus morhua TaxID=8049 RepID=UPI0011B683BE|nr:synaptotagmin-16 isoform X1 [Gadus morhua]
MASDSCLLVWSDQCVIVCPLSLSLSLPVTPEALGFLTAVAVFVVALGVLFLFITKKLCFSRVGGLPCLEQTGPGRKTRRHGGLRQGLVNSYGHEEDFYEEEGSSASDGEEEVLKQFEISVSRSHSFRGGGASHRAAARALSQPAGGGRGRGRGRRGSGHLLSDQDEVSSGASECGDMEDRSSPGFQDPPVSLQVLESRERPQSSRPETPRSQTPRSQTGTSRNQTGTPRSQTPRSQTPRSQTPRSQTGTPRSQTGTPRSQTGTLKEPSLRGARGSLRPGATPTPTPTPTPSLLGPGAPGGEEQAEVQAEEENAGLDNNDATDSSSTWSPEGEPPPLGDAVPGEPAAVSPAPRGPPVTTCGHLLLSLEYRPEAERLQVRVIAARDIPDKARSGMDCHQVHVVLLPAKRQRRKTSAQKGPQPRFDDAFRFARLDPSDLLLSGLRFRLYALGGRMARERLVGESILRLGGLNPDGGTMETSLVLEPRSNLKSLDSQLSLAVSPPGEGVSSGQSLAHGGVPELLLGLSYKATTGRMSVEVLKGSHFRNMAVTRPPDTYCRLVLLNSVGQEISRCKTSVRRGQPNPVFKETFVFQVALFQLSDVTLMVSIYSRRSMKRKEMVGWVSLGQNSSGEEELLHWEDMKDGQGQWVSRWHMLLDA